ncbi:MAG: phosphatidylglycerophosphatase A [Spirochaetota bacterium]|jgi:phosphatidylglycerophosphatase A
MWWKEFLFTALYTGYFPWMPGTAASLFAMLLYFTGYCLFGEAVVWINAAATVLLLYPGVKLGDAGERFFAEKDPPQIVLDEVLGYGIAVLFHPFSWKTAVLAFVIFRVFDILKPWPTRRLQSIKGGLGVMIDDWVAGIYTSVIIVGLKLLLPALGIAAL